MPLKLDTPTARLRLPIARKPKFIQILPGRSLGYRRNRSAGTWVERVADGGGGSATKAIGTADDFMPDDGEKVLSFWQAAEKVRARAREADKPAGPLTLAEAIDAYERDRRVNQGDPANASRLRRRLPADLMATAVADLTSKRLSRWRDDLAEDVSAATVNRITRVLKAALNLAAASDTKLNPREWSVGLKGLQNAERSRNAESILTDDVIRRLIAAAHDLDHRFGLLVEVAAVTGARCGQLAEIRIDDLLPDRLMIPPSRKGRTKNKPDRIPVPISPDLADRLRRDAPAGAALLVQSDGLAWPTAARRGDRVTRSWRKLGVEATMYSLRHSSIVRQLRAGVPIRIVASVHDTSVAMIERTYSRYIADHSDALVRAALLT